MSIQKSKRKILIALNCLDFKYSDKYLKSFWHSLILIQKNIPENILVDFILIHSYKDSLEQLKFIFQPIQEIAICEEKIFIHYREKTKSFKIFNEYINVNKSINKKLKDSITQSYLISETCNILMASNNKVNFEQLILLNISNFILLAKNQTFIYDPHLPLDKIYLKYNDQIDIGYSTNLIIIPFNYLNIFSKFQEFFISSLNDENNFLNCFTKNGWLFSYRKNIFEIIYFCLIRSIRVPILNLILNFEKINQLKIIKLLRVSGIINRIKIIVNIPNLNYENSFVGLNRSNKVFSLKNVSLIKPILKYFIFKNNLRDNTRFVKDDDFQCFKSENFLIRKDFILVLTKDKFKNVTEIKRQILNLKLKPTYIFIFCKNKIYLFKYQYVSNKIIIKTFRRNLENKLFNLVKIIKFYKNSKLSKLPFLFIDSLHNYSKCKDYCYLNTIILFFICRNIQYFSLVNFKSFNKNMLYSRINFKYNIDDIDNCIISFDLLRKRNLIRNLDHKELKFKCKNSLFFSRNKKLF